MYIYIYLFTPLLTGLAFLEDQMQVVSGEYDRHLYAVNGHLEAE